LREDHGGVIAADELYVRHATVGSRAEPAR
jgi:hypothetical protein